MSGRLHLSDPRLAGLLGALVFATWAVPVLLGLSLYGLDFDRSELGVGCALRNNLSRDLGLELNLLSGHGTPLWLRPVAQVLYLPQWLALPFSAGVGATLKAGLHAGAGAAATFWLGRTFGLRRPFAAAAALAFVFSGTGLDLHRHSVYGVALLWLPLGWALVRWTLEPDRPRRVGLLLVGINLVMCLFGGEPLTFGLASGLVLLEGADAARRRRHHPLVLLRLGAVVAGAFAVGLVQWLPALAEMALSFRNTTLTRDIVLMWAFEPLGWAATVLPGLASGWVGASPFEALLLESPEPGIPPMWNPHGYLGLPLVTLALLGLLTARRRRLTLSVVLVGGVLLALGERGLVLPLALDVIPGLGALRFPAKLLPLVTLAACVLGLGAAQAVSRHRALRRALLLGLGLAALAFLTARLGLVLADDALGAGLATPSGALVAMEPILDHVGASLAHALIASVLALTLVLTTQRAARGALALAGLLVADLLVAAPGALALGPDITEARSVVADALADEPGAVVCHAFESPPQPPAAPDADPRWLSSVAARAFLMPELNTCDEVALGEWYSPLESLPSAWLRFALGQGVTPAARALGCTHVLHIGPLSGPVDRVPWWTEGERPTWKVAGVSLSRVRTPVPGAWTIDHPVWVDDEDALRDALVQPPHRDDTLRLVDAPLGRTARAALHGAEGGLTIASAARPSTGEIVISPSGSSGVVAVRTAYLVGWRASQGETALPVVRVGGIFVGAVVTAPDAGPVVFRYQPPRWGLARALGLLGVLLLLGASLLGNRASRGGAPREEGADGLLQSSKERRGRPRQQSDKNRSATGQV